MYCADCGYETAAGTRFCGNCGGLLGDPPPAVVIALQSAPAKPVAPTLPPDAQVIPWYLRWYLILPLFFVWPWHAPFGVFAGVGLLLMRMKAVPSSRGKVGWLFVLIGLSCLLMSAVAMVMLFDAKTWHWVFTLAEGGAVSSLLAVAYGVIVALRARKVSKLIEAVNQLRLEKVEDIAATLGRNDLNQVATELRKIIRRGWLDGYQVDITGRQILYVAPSQHFLHRMKRCWTGSLCLATSLVVLFIGYELSLPPSVESVLDEADEAVAASKRAEKDRKDDIAQKKWLEYNQELDRRDRREKEERERRQQ